ncbi:MAG: hypothetical protein IKO55_16955 [Kiritimatiellae bacterium]|nr:hypothetical protein [Kiritimatiellia bacterium]
MQAWNDGIDDHAVQPLQLVELMCAPIRYDQGPRRYWKKSQKKIRRERRQRMAYKKGKVRK